METRANLKEPYTSKKKKHYGKGLKPSSKANKFNGSCYNYGKLNHIIRMPFSKERQRELGISDRG